MQEVKKYVSDDGNVFESQSECLEYEGKINKWNALIKSKIGEYQKEELILGNSCGEIYLKSLPFEAPWMGPFGAGLIGIVDIRRNSNRKVEFLLADENKNPYKDKEGNFCWVEAGTFYYEWPK